MKISVKNFGPIGEAKDIHLSPMTLFVGPSNTGKSYLAVLLYTIVESIEESFRPLANAQIRKRQKLKRDPEVQERIDRGVSVREATKETVEAWCASMFIPWTEGLAGLWRKKILYCFGEEGENLIQDKKVSVVMYSDDGEVIVDLVSPKRSKINPRALSKMVDKLIDSFSEMPLEVEFRFQLSAPINPHLLARAFRSALWDEMPDTAHYLPAIRGGIMQSHRGLVDAVMAQAPFVGLQGHFHRMNSTPMFTGVLSDFMRKLIDVPVIGIRAYRRTSPFMPRRIRQNSNIVPIGERMENEIMDGEIKIRKNETGYPDFRYKFSRGGKERELSLNNTSSMVSELAPISVFVRHHLGEGDLFIVEEPEAHLHPKGQRAISDVLVQLANAGVFVLATTHSDIVLEQIGNAVRRAGLENKKSAAKNGGVSLNENQAAAYSFHERIRGKTKVKSVKFETVEGFATDDHLKASTALYNETVALWNADES